MGGENSGDGGVGDQEVRPRAAGGMHDARPLEASGVGVDHTDVGGQVAAARSVHSELRLGARAAGEELPGGQAIGVAVRHAGQPGEDGVGEAGGVIARDAPERAARFHSRKL